MTENLSDSYFINSSNYQQVLGDMFRVNNFIPEYIVQYPIVLPFHIPFDDNTTLTFDRNDKYHLSYIFSTIKKEYDHLEALNTHKKITSEIRQSRVEMIYSTIIKVTGEDEHELTIMFDELLLFLNAIINSYTIRQRDYSAYSITKEMLSTFCMIQIQNVVDFSEPKNILFHLHMDIPYLRKEISLKESRNILRLAFELNKSSNIMFPSSEFMFLAQRNCVKGFFRESIIFCQISIESLLDNLLKELLINESFSEEDIEKVFTLGFITRVKKEFMNRLGGNWNIDDNNAAIGKWYTNTYLI